MSAHARPSVQHASPVESERRELPWILAALLVHAAASLGATTSLNEMGGIVREMRASIRDQLGLEVSIEPAPQARAPEPEPEPEPPPEPEVAPPPPPVAPPKEEDPYDLPPAPAEALKVLTQEPEVAEKPSETAFATGKGQVAFGMVAGAGTGNSPTFSRHAVVGGKPGGRGTKMPPAPPPPDLSRPPTLRDPDWGCDFPAKAEADGLMSGVARFLVTVRPDGVAQSVKLVMDPGHGFGAEAYRCAMRQHYIPGRDRAGRPTTAVLGPIGIRFMR